MSIVLPDDIVLVPVDALAEDVRRNLVWNSGDHALTRPRSRMPSCIVDARTAGLLEQFRRPATIVDAVIAYSTAERLDPRETLESAFPVLRRFLDTGLLLPAASRLATSIAHTFTVGDRIGAFEIVDPVHVVVDTEVYLAKTECGERVALKVARPGSEVRMARQLEHEAMILRELAGERCARFVAVGEVRDLPFLATSWCDGVDVHEAAAGLRALGRAGRDALMRLVEAVVEAYACIHRRGVLQADVHPRNVMVDADMNVTLIDFGLARSATGSSANAARGAVDLFMEPELARARLAGGPSPQATAAGERYAVAALVYLIVSGACTHDFALEEKAMLRQVIDLPARGFADRGVDDCARLESVLGVALAKAPDDRHPTTDAFLDAVRMAIAADGASRAHPPAPAPRRRSQSSILLDEVLERLAPERFGRGVDRVTPPIASIHGGAAGVAYALLRIARHRDDERLLALADQWSNRAVVASESSPDDAFWNAEVGLTRAVTGDRSLLHTASGVRCVEALVAQARGDEAAHRRANDAFIAQAPVDTHALDLAFGRAGLLVGCALLHDASPASDTALRGHGDRLCASLWRDAVLPPKGDGAMEVRSFGAAHGWAGVLHAVLRWHACTGSSLPEGFVARLDVVAAAALPAGRGLRWPMATAHGGSRSGPLQASWCNGAAGFVALWALAYRMLGDERYRRLAIGAGWSAFDMPHASADLCCGLAGRAYALLTLSRVDASLWHDRAAWVAERAAIYARKQPPCDTLYAGTLGIALLAIDLERPEHAAMPFFEGEGWRN